MLKFIFYLLSTLLFSAACFSKKELLIPDISIYQKYEKAYDSLKTILLLNGQFKAAVFITEQTYSIDMVSLQAYNRSISFIETLGKGFINSVTNNYHWRDSTNHAKNLSIYSVFIDTSYIFADTSLTDFLPFTYNFTDPFGKQDWSNMFVTKLLATHKGNCHSLAYLYKILADEIGAKCWLSLAPGHIYIKNYSEKIGWYNTELTSGTFPTDASVMVTGYVNPEAIKSGLYMDTLSNQQSIALCVLDLAKEYEFQTHNYYDGFILKCCDLVLQYHPVNPMALLLKAETLKKVWLKETENKYPKPTSTPLEMQNAYITLAKLGYREMSEKMYQQWLQDMITQKDKYSNPKVNSSVKQK